MIIAFGLFLTSALAGAGEALPEISDPLSADVVSKAVYTCTHGFPEPIQVLVDYSRIRSGDLTNVNDRFDQIVARGVPISTHLLDEINSQIANHSIESVYVVCSSPDLQIKISISEIGAASGSGRLYTTLLIDEHGTVRWRD